MPADEFALLKNVFGVEEKEEQAKKLELADLAGVIGQRVEPPSTQAEIAAMHQRLVGTQPEVPQYGHYQNWCDQLMEEIAAGGDLKEKSIRVRLHVDDRWVGPQPNGNAGMVMQWSPNTRTWEVMVRAAGTFFTIGTATTLEVDMIAVLGKDRAEQVAIDFDFRPAPPPEVRLRSLTLNWQGLQRLAAAIGRLGNP